MMRFKSLLIVVYLLSFAYSSKAQSLNQSAEKIKTAFATSDIEGLMSMYADTVHYIDPFWGSDEYYLKQTVKSFFAPSFTEKGKPSLFAVKTVATAQDQDVVMLKGKVFNQQEKKHFPFVIHMKLSNGIIVEQTDFPVYPLSILRYSPRLKDHLKPAEKKGQ